MGDPSSYLDLTLRELCERLAGEHGSGCRVPAEPDVAALRALKTAA